MSNRVHFTLRIEGMTCEGCARHVIQALKGVPGVESAEVGDWRTGTAAVVANANVSEEALSEAVAKAGYRAIVEAKRPLEGERQVPRSQGADFDLMTIGGGSIAATMSGVGCPGSKGASRKHDPAKAACAPFLPDPRKVAMCAYHVMGAIVAAFLDGSPLENSQGHQQRRRLSCKQRPPCTPSTRQAIRTPGTAFGTSFQPGLKYLTMSETYPGAPSLDATETIAI